LRGRVLRKGNADLDRMRGAVEHGWRKMPGCIRDGPVARFPPYTELNLVFVSWEIGHARRLIQPSVFRIWSDSSNCCAILRGIFRG